MKEVESVTLTADNVSKFLGSPPHFNDRIFPVQATLPSGVVIGLAYNELGGKQINE
jgi:ATP-dependent Lon protease